MSIPAPVLRAASLAMAVLALSLAATAMSPAGASALPTQSSPGDSEYCTSLLDRLKRYHTIATDPAEPQSVRDFYRARAGALLVRARAANCGWATSMLITGVATLPAADTASRSAAVTGLTGPAGRTVHRATFTRLTASRRGVTHAAKRTATGSGTRVPSSQTSVAAIKATSTGNAQQDDYCAAVAKLIDEAELAGDLAAGQGNDDEADAWWGLADSFVDRATQNGCRFTLARTAAAGTRAPSAVATRR